YHGANDVEGAMDWLDIQLGRSDAQWRNDLIYPWDYAHWAAQQEGAIDVTQFPARTVGDLLTAADGSAIGSTAEWERKAADVRAAVEWLLGDATPGTRAEPFPEPRLGDPGAPAAPARGRGGAPPPPARVTLFVDIHG